MKKMKKKAWACLMALAMILTMLPGMAVKAEAATGYGIWVGDTEVTSACTSGEGWSYDATTGTLTLDNFYYKGEGKTPDSSNRGGICVLRPNSANQSPATLYIKLQGSNYIENTSKRSYWNAGIFSYSDLVISGEGSLTAKGGIGGTSHGISGQNLIIESGTIEAEGRASAGSSGIYMSGNVTVNGGKVTASADNSTTSKSRGIECDGSFIMNGGEVTTTAKNAKSTGYGIEAGSDIKHNGGILKAEGETQALYSHTNSYPEGYGKGKEYPGKKTLTATDFTFSAPSDLIYDKRGKESKVVFNGDNDCGDITVKYYDADNKLVDGLPTEVGGPYTVKIDVAENDEYAGATDLTDPAWEFAIEYGEATSEMYTVSGINAAGWAKDKVIITGNGDNKVAIMSTNHFADSTYFSGRETNNGNVTIYVQNASGKVYRQYLAYKLDKTAPVIDGLEDGKVYCGTSKEFSVSDALSGLADVKDGEKSLGTAGTYQLAAGTHTITATDTAGNSTTVNVEVNGEHEYKNVEYIWNAGNTECKAHVVCKNCGQEVDETATVISEVTQQQTCVLPEKTTYTAVFENKVFETQKKEMETKSALGHTSNKDDGDCTTAVTCVRCDYVFVAAKAEHNFGGEMQKEESGHWTVCQNKDCTKENREAHIPDIEAPTENQDQKCKECGYIIANKLGHQHKLHLKLVEAKAPTCTEEGNQAYYICTEDLHCFFDKDAENPVDYSDMVIAKTEHDYGDPVYIWSNDNTTCTATISCKTCQTIVESEEAQMTSEVTQKQSCTESELTTYTATFNNTAFAVQQKKVQTKEAAGHAAGNWIVDRESTVTIAGSRHKECTVCGTVLQTETIAKLPTPAPVTYKIIEGADDTYTINADGTYTIRANGEFSKFVNVEMDGKVVDSKNYTAKSGSTIITFSKEYMSSLSAGKHTVKVNFTDGSAETTLTVAQKDTKDTGKTDVGKKPASKSAKTGDNSNLIAWFILLAASVCIVGSLRTIRRQRRR